MVKQTNKQQKIGISKFAGKRMELENTVLSEVTQTQKDKQYAFTHEWILDIKKRITRPQHLRSKVTRKTLREAFMDAPVGNRSLE